MISYFGTSMGDVGGRDPLYGLVSFKYVNPSMLKTEIAPMGSDNRDSTVIIKNTFITTLKYSKSTLITY